MICRIEKLRRSLLGIPRPRRTETRKRLCGGIPAAVKGEHPAVLPSADLRDHMSRGPEPYRPIAAPAPAAVNERQPISPAHKERPAERIGKVIQRNRNGRLGDTCVAKPLSRL